MPKIKSLTSRLPSYLRHFSAGGISGTTALNLIAVLCGVGSGVTLARSLGPGGRGELAAALMWPNLLALFADMGLGFAFAYGASQWRDRFDELWTLCLLLGVLLGAVAMLAGWLLLPRLAGNLSDEGRLGMKIAFGAVPWILLAGYQAFLFLGIQRVAAYNAVRMVAPVSNLLTVLFIAASGKAGVILYSAAFVATQLLAFLFSTILLWQRLRPRFHLCFDLAPGLLSYGFKTQLGGLVGQANLRLDQSIMSLWVAPEKLGLYVVSVSISAVAAPLMNALAVVALPRTAHAKSGSGTSLVVAKHVKQALISSLPLTLLWILVMPWVLPGFFGKAYSPAVVSAQILTAAAMIQGLNTIMGNSLRGLGRPGLCGIAEGAGMAITITLLYFLLPALGIAGAAITSLCAYSLVAALQFVFLARSAGLSTRLLAQNVMEYDPFDLSRRFRRAINTR